MNYHISISTQALEKVIRLRACLVSIMNQLQQLHSSITAEEFTVNGRFVYEIHSGKGQSIDKEIRRVLGEGLADFICDCEEPEMIRGMLRYDYKYYCNNEVAEIQKVVERLLEGSAWECARVVYVNRRQKLAKQLYTYLTENKELAIDGFVNFRLAPYKEALSRCVKEAIDEYVMDQQYQEFISLLQSFVAVQAPTVRLVHVIHNEKNRFRVLKEDGTQIKTKEMDGIFKEAFEQSFSHEDMIVSTLLSVVPEHVVLHTKDPEETLVRTLMQVFQGRIDLCYGCSQCGISLNCQEDA